MEVWRGLFAMAALFNVGIAGMMLAAPGRIAGHLSVSGPGGPYAIALIGLLIGLFGIGYAIVAYAPAHNRGIVWIGLFGKLGAAGLGALQFAAGVIQFRLFALGIGDLVFAALFAVFLWRSRRRA